MPQKLFSALTARQSGDRLVVVRRNHGAREARDEPALAVLLYSGIDEGAGGPQGFIITGAKIGTPMTPRDEYEVISIDGEDLKLVRSVLLGWHLLQEGGDARSQVKVQDMHPWHFGIVPRTKHVVLALKQPFLGKVGIFLNGPDAGKLVEKGTWLNHLPGKIEAALYGFAHRFDTSD